MWVCWVVGGKVNDGGGGVGRGGVEVEVEEIAVGLLIPTASLFLGTSLDATV